MSTLTHICLLAGLAAGSGVAHAQNTASDDPNLWLEDVTGSAALDWVKQRNAQTETELATTPEFKQLESQILDVLDSDAKIPNVQKIGGHYYNFWKDKNHQRGIWRRTTLEEYRKPQPRWETVLDLDALNQAEGENWVWDGARCLPPEYRRCLIELSRGGADANVTREFDLIGKGWVKDGFFRKESKGGMAWIDQDNAYVFTDFGAGTMTTSGYPRVVKRWKRGTPIEAAVTVYEGKPEDTGITAERDPTPGFERDFVSRMIAFYNDELYLRRPDGTLVKVDAPNSANKRVHRQWLMLELREPWSVGGQTYPAGALLVTDFDAYMAGKRDMKVLFEPTDTTSLAGVTTTANHVVFNILDDVKNRFSVWTFKDGAWQSSALAGVPPMGRTSIQAVDSLDSDALWVNSMDFLTPSTLSMVEPGKPLEKLKSNPVFFDGSKHVVEQHFVASKDGTRVPYFLVRPKDLAYDGKAPTLLYGYGGFEISMLPTYSGSLGKGWLEKGGVYVLANIRGGGEYGPRWHQAALKANRHKAYEDFAAIADDLVKRNITSAAHLGAQGGSNGGLLAGNMLTQYPDKFGAIVVQVPLLDMKRYSHLLAGASWMAEYGDPDKPEEWAFIRTFSPYHLFDPTKTYPPTLFTTSTRDDRVHPGHARKMMAKMLEAKKNARYYENIEGGHGGAADNKQVAHMQALAYTFLWGQLNSPAK